MRFVSDFCDLSYFFFLAAYTTVMEAWQWFLAVEGIVFWIEIMKFFEEFEFFSFWLAIYACQWLVLMFYHGSNRDGLGQWKPDSGFAVIIGRFMKQFYNSIEL